MRDLVVFLVHVIGTLSRLMGSGGIRSVVAESVLVEQQLVILNRSRQRAPRLRASDRFVAGLCTLFMQPTRVIGTIRREYLDRTLFWTSADLESKLLEFRNYYNRHRTHTSLEGRTADQDTSVSRPLADLHSYRWQPHCQRLYQTPVAA
jgi:hypothetical protein